MDEWNSKVNVLYIYERLYDALDSNNIEEEVSELFDEMAHNFEVDTGGKVGEALGWNECVHCGAARSECE